MEFGDDIRKFFLDRPKLRETLHFLSCSVGFLHVLSATCNRLFRRNLGFNDLNEIL
jgi:hypothetical protein